MTYLCRTLLASALAAPLSVAAVAQEQAAPEGAPPEAEYQFNTEMTCGEFNDLEEADQTAAMEALALQIGMDQEGADEETDSMHLADMRQFCETTPDMSAMEAFQNAMDNPD